VHRRLLVTSAAPIFDDIEAYPLSVDHEIKLADDSTAAPPDTTRYNLLYSPYAIGIPKEADSTKLELALGQVEKLWIRRLVI
jgi:hypothetical protein